MSIAVVFVTGYMLMVPAVTAEKMNSCDLKLHKHTKDCYNEKKELICGYADFVVHTHEQNCYNKEGLLICPLPEKKEHVHGAACYTKKKELVCGQEEKEGHMHQPECYERQKGELICTTEEHIHNLECYDEFGKLICQKEEHTHTDECYQWKDVLVCGKEESPGHTHTEECYKTNEVLVCKKPEIVLHTHTDKCYEKGKLICGKVEVQKHQHTKKCFADEKKELENLENKFDQKNKETMQNAGIPLDMEKYIQKFKISYKNKDNTNWIEITDTTQNIPGDATVLLHINYHEVKIDDLKKAGYQIKYTLPSLLKEPEVGGELKSDGITIGTIQTTGKDVILTFYQNWIEEQEKLEMYEINGDFYIQSQFDGSGVEEGKPGAITIGGKTVIVNFEEDVAAKHGRVTIEKSRPSFQEDEKGCYLTYTLTVKVPEGAADVPDVKVVDQFTKNGQYIEQYIGVTGNPVLTTNNSSGPIEMYPHDKEAGQVYLGNNVSENQLIPEPAGEKLTKPGILVWKIGKMTAGETRTLTYKVKLKENYKAVNVNNNNNAITNMASIYSKTYLRGESGQNHTPNIKVTLEKTAGEYKPNRGDNGGTITYKIWIKALQENSYTIDNVKVTDFFQTSELVPYLTYVKDSFHLYKGDGIDGTEIKLNDVRPNNQKENPVITNASVEKNAQKKFDLYIGSLAPGEVKTVVYTVKIHPDIWVNNNHDIKLGNRAVIFSDDSKAGGNQQYEAYSCEKTISGKKWNRKLAGEFLKTEKKIQIPKEDAVYDEKFNLIKDNKPTDFVVPAYSQKYELVANEEGILDFSDIQFTDVLQEAGKIKYSGYLKVDAYSLENPTAKIVSDEEAINTVKKGRLVKSVWLDINNENSFVFRPSQLGLTGKYAYIVTYYVSLQSPEKHYHITIHNNFKIEGDAIGKDGEKINIPGITVNNASIIQGEKHYSSQKLGWYYKQPQIDATQNWRKGELYWVIKISGTSIPQGMKLKDIVSDTSMHKVYPEESLVGIYKGKLPKGTTLADYKTLDGVSGLTRLNGTYSSDSNDKSGDFRWEVKPDDQHLFIEFNNDIPLLDGEEVYAVVKTAPQQLPQGKRDSKDFTNKLQTYHVGSDQWKDEPNAKLTVHSSDKIFKETQGAYTYDGSTWKTLTSGMHSNADNLAKNLIKEPGTYIEWLVHINWDGTMSGTAQIEDQLPEGVELTYVRYYWLSPYYREKGQTIPITPEIQNLEQDSEWEKRTNTLLSQEPAERTCISYYNPKTGKVKWNIDHLQSGGTRDQRAVEFQVVCKVTDQNALMSGKDVTMKNSITVTDNMGKYSDSDDIVFRKKTLSKIGTYDKNDGADYPFEIELNPLGEDLVPNVDELTVVDELSSSLILAPETIKVINQKTKEDVTSLCHVSITETNQGQILYVTVPDSMQLKITYEALVNAKPGQAIAISNQAHWEGQEVAEGGEVSQPDFSYSAGGSAGGDPRPSLKVMKLDKEHVLKKLEGAIFSVQKMIEQQDGTLKPEGEKHMETTDVDGVAMFSQPSRTNRWMEFNTIYCLKEEQAPLGYVKDDTPYYFAIVEDSGADGNDKFPEYVHIWYQSPQYTYAAYNHKGEIVVDKGFKQADGSPLEHPLDGRYQFGIFTDQNASEKPLQTISITYQNGKPTYQKDGQEVAEPVFTQLDVDNTKNYYVFELDDKGKPIKQNELATISDKTFEVTYSGNGISLENAKNGRSTIKVINTTKQFILPETGGKGISGYLISGIVVLALSIVGYFYQKEKIRRRKR